MISYVKKFTHSGFVRNVAIVATGTAGAQAIAMAFVPIITRLYGPETFGILGTFTAILEILIPLAALSYPIAIVLPRRNEDAHNLVKLSLLIALFMSIITTIIVTTYGNSLAERLNLQDISPYLLLLPAGMFFSVCMAVSNQLAIRKKIFKIRAKSTIIQSFVINVIKSALGFVNPTATILITTTISSYLLSALMLWPSTRNKNELTEQIDEYKKTNTELLIEYKDFALYRTPQALLNSIGQSLPILMLSSLFGPAAAGFYALSRTVLFVPSTLLGQSVADVFYPKFVEVIHSGENGRRLLLKTCSSLAAIGSLPYLSLILLGPWLFSIIFGAAWLEAGEYARWMSAWLYLVLVTRPIIAAIPALSLQGFFLAFELLALIVRTGSIFAGYWINESALAAVIAFSLCNILIYAILACIVIQKSK